MTYLILFGVLVFVGLVAILFVEKYRYLSGTFFGIGLFGFLGILSEHFYAVEVMV